MTKVLFAVLVMFMMLGQAVAASQDSQEVSHEGLGSFLFGYGAGRLRGSGWGRGWGGYGGGWGGYGGYGGGYGGWGRGWGWKHNAQASESTEE